MRAKVFDPFSEDAVNAWLAADPPKVIHSARLFDSTTGGVERQVAVVLFAEERRLAPPAEAPLVVTAHAESA